MPSRLTPRAVVLIATALVGAAALGAQSPMTVEEAAAESQRGDQFFADARYPDAYEAYHRALEAGAPDVVSHARKGKIRSAIRLARFQIARTEAETLKASAENDPEANTMFADALWGEALFDEAEAAYQDAFKQHPQWPRAQFGVARSLATHGQLNEALTVALAAYAAAPKDPEVLVLIGELYERLYRFDDAAKMLEEYVDGPPPPAPWRVGGRVAEDQVPQSLQRPHAGGDRGKSRDAPHRAVHAERTEDSRCRRAERPPGGPRDRHRRGSHARSPVTRRSGRTCDPLPTR